MTPELMYLVWSAALTLVLAVIAVSGATLEVGLPKLAGNREGMAEMPGWAGFFGRLAHAIIYIAGVPWLRTAAWLVSVIGLLLIFAQLVA